jgi:hypothetical protein
MRIPSERYSGPEPYDIEANYARVYAIWQANPYRDAAFCNKHCDEVLISALKGRGTPSLQFVQAVGNLMYGLYEYDGLYEVKEPYKLEHDLIKKEKMYEEHAARLADANRTMRDFFVKFFRHVKAELAYGEPENRTVPLIELCDSPRATVQEFFSTFVYSDLFPRTREQMLLNLADVSGLNPDKLPENPKYKWPRDSDLGSVELNNQYFWGTPFEKILLLQVPLKVPERIRFEHAHVVAGSGAGKTTLLTQQLLEDVFDEKRPTLIVIDGKGTWAPVLQRFACFAPDRAQSERLIVINPQDRHPAALNMFAADERIIDGISENLAYIFGSRDFDLSAKQRTAFTYAAQLVFSMPGSTIETLLALMQDPAEKSGGVPASSPFREAIDRQPHINRRFLNELFYHPTEFLETKRQIQNRIYDLLSCPAFAAMFTQQENRLDMRSVMQRGKILIVDASPGAVGDKAASTFGRYIISLALTTARSRIDIPRDQWRPTYLYIDEAQLFVDEERTQPLLQQAREFNLGVILSHQKLDDLSATLRATFAGNTSSKYCGHPSHDDARNMAKEMRTDADFIMSQQHRDGHAHFAAYIRGITPRALSYSFPLGTMVTTEKMSDAQYRDLMARNRALMSPPRKDPEPPPPEMAPPRPKPPTDMPSGKAKGLW